MGRDVRCRPIRRTISCARRTLDNRIFVEHGTAELILAHDLGTTGISIEGFASPTFMGRPYCLTARMAGRKIGGAGSRVVANGEVRKWAC